MSVWCDYCPSRDLFPRGYFMVVVDGKRYCARHWVGHGRPGPKRPPSPEEVQEREAETRIRMQARGGAARHLVRSGRT